VQVDLVMQPERREAMLAASGGVRQLPQVHVNGKVSCLHSVSCTVQTDCTNLRLSCTSHQLPCSSQAFGCHASAGVPQYIGDADTLQTLEDRGELQNLLEGASQ
jgi:hypothetical protein